MAHNTKICSKFKGNIVLNVLVDILESANNVINENGVSLILRSIIIIWKNKKAASNIRKYLCLLTTKEFLSIC